MLVVPTLGSVFLLVPDFEQQQHQYLFDENQWNWLRSGRFAEKGGVYEHISWFLVDKELDKDLMQGHKSVLVYVSCIFCHTITIFV